MCLLFLIHSHSALSNNHCSSCFRCNCNMIVVVVVVVEMWAMKMTNHLLSVLLLVSLIQLKSTFLRLLVVSNSLCLYRCQSCQNDSRLVHLNGYFVWTNDDEDDDDDESMLVVGWIAFIRAQVDTFYFFRKNLKLFFNFVIFFFGVLFLSVVFLFCQLAVVFICALF